MEAKIVVEETSGWGCTKLLIDESVNLNGGGIVTLSSISGSFTTHITDGLGSDGILTNVDNTIQGRGRVGGNRVRIIDETGGTIHANDSSGPLTIDPSDDILANEGTLRASNGATLNVAGTLDNLGRIEGDGTIDSTLTKQWFSSKLV